jgi:uncharacterized protein (DUF2267 family)
MKRARVARGIAFGTVVSGVLVLLTRGGRTRTRHLVKATARRTKYLSGRLEGLRYRLAGRHPDPSVGGAVLADRVRSVLGPLEHQLDIPRLHVMAEGHGMLLHGDVATEEQIGEVVDAVRRVPGVASIESHLQVGFFRGETRPSEGHAHHPPSRALTSVLAAAHGGGAPVKTERAAASAVLTTFLALLPTGERQHVLTHLPADLRALAAPSKTERSARRRPRHLEQFMTTALPATAPGERETIVESVIGAVRELVPEEAVDVAAVLPPELRHLWKTAVPL